MNKSINIIDEKSVVIEGDSPSPSLSDNHNENLNLQLQNKNSNNNKYNINIEILDNKDNNNNKNNTKPYHLQNSPDNIINANKYNLEDCTTDKSCLIPEDENNLYPGFHKKNNNYNNIYKVKKPKKISIKVVPKKMNNTLSIEENVTVEKFTNNKTPRFK